MSLDVATSLRGSLLLAAPLLSDPNFARAVLYLAAHSEKDGAFGYILNRPLDKKVSDLLPTEDMGRLARIPVFLGGPVATDKLSFASMQWSNKKNTLKCQTHLSVDDALYELDMGHEVRAFVGYTGWSEGQLEGEMKHRSWIATAPKPIVMSAGDVTTLWSDILEKMGPRYDLMSRMPEKPGMN